MTKEINGYRMKTEFSTRDAGMCRWGFCEKNGKEYFIKEFLSPKYPMDNRYLSAETIARKRKICEQFQIKRKKFYDTLRHSDSGNNIIVEDFFRYGSTYYAIQKKIDTSCLEVNEIKTLSWEKKEVLLRAIAYSVSQFHENGIIHADIKPSNILPISTNKGFLTAKIIDFDSGFLRKEPPVPDEIQGDFVFLAPEVFLFQKGEKLPLTEKIDIFALGILFHLYCTGKYPVAYDYMGKKYQYLFEAVIAKQKCQFGEELPDYLQKLIEKMLSLDAADRPSAQGILETLKEKEATSSASSSKSVGDTAEIGWHVPGDL